MERQERSTSTAARTNAPAEDNFRVQAPSVSLPKGGGAIKGIGEKFATNPVTGTGSMSVPIATSPGRSGFGPQLSLSYDSGAGNGPFGFGWGLALPSITRKTDKGLPRYADHEDSDVFILSGAEDLVPVLNGDGTRPADDTRSLEGADWWIRRYRPRIEGLFARIERWTKKDGTAVAWRSISRDNIITWYGKDEGSRIADPDDPTRIFTWLICQSYDDKGNAMVYSYLKENDDGIDKSQANERNRTTSSRSAQRYLDRIRYGNRQSTLDPVTGVRPPQLEDAWLADTADWMFEVVFDYERGYYEQEDPDADERVFGSARIDPTLKWPVRKDPFSSHRSGFEVRTYRLCRRVLMFHYFPEELGTADCLVRSTEFSYKEDSVASFITSVIQSGFVRQADGRYLKRSMPPVVFTYSQVEIDSTVQSLDTQSMENLPMGIEGAYHFVDLDGEGSSGVLTEHVDAWYYKPPLGDGKLGSMTAVARKPNASLAGGSQLLDLAGDGQLDLANFRGPVTGFYERTDEADWETLRAFKQVPNIAWDDPNLRFVDVNGDGHADVLITEHQAITWYPSRAEEGFDAAERVFTPFDEEKGPSLIFADGTQSIYLADMCGDGLTDLVRIRNGEVCYWPNLGYGRFGAKVTMDNSPWFDHPDQFDQKRVRIADIDGSGNIDILYLAVDRARVFLNQSGNRFVEAPQIEHAFPYDNLKNVATADILGKGTACLVWTSSLPGDARLPMKFIDLMRNGKPHLLIKTENNLGAETVVHYAPSTKFYFDDKRAGKPWITRLAFPVHVVERVETYDRISRNRFVTRYAYHHGYFDGPEREFRGFGMVEQWDTEEFSALGQSDAFPTGDNVDQQSHVPPMYTKTWFHTGSFLDGERISTQYANEYFREAAWSDAEFSERLLPDTNLPDGLATDEMREACRALKGAILRQEVYADDGTAKAHLPYSVSERNYTVKRLQRRGTNKHAVFFTHADETIDFHYERNPQDPRISHALTLEVDGFGNTLKAAAIGYGRGLTDAELLAKEPELTPIDRDRQRQLLITCSENEVTNAVDDADAHRTPLPSTTDSFEITGLAPAAKRFTAQEFLEVDTARPGRMRLLQTIAEIPYEATATAGAQKRIIERLRSYYRSDDLSQRLPLGVQESLALPFESYKLALTAGLVADVFQRGRPVRNEPILPDPALVLDGNGADQGGYVSLDGDDRWWIASGRMRFTDDDAHTAMQEQQWAIAHFYLPGLFTDPFGTTTSVAYDAHDLAVVRTRDAIGNTVSARLDYRVLQPALTTDPNGNRSQAAFDALGMVTATAIMGKEAPAQQEGDSLSGINADLTDAQVAAHFADPLADPHALLGDASTRLMYDLFAYQRSKHLPQPHGVMVSTIARETHVADLAPGAKTKVQVNFSYSDGFGRDVQMKVQAEPGPVENGGTDVNPRWVGSGWTIFNNKGKPVRQYEPFFSTTHTFEFAVMRGVSPVLFYDPAGRVVCTLNPDHTWQKVLFDPWKQISWDASDTVLLDPAADPDMGVFFQRLPASEYQPTWHALRTDPAHVAALTAQYPDGTDRTNETGAANKAAAHAATPTVAHADALGRTMLTIADNGPAGKYATRVVLDIEGNQREVVDALGRVVMRYAYDMLGTRIHQSSMEAGARWMLNDCLGNPIRAWDERAHTFRNTYDRLRRPAASFVIGADEADPTRELRVGQTLYGDTSASGLNEAQRLAGNTRGKPVMLFDQAGLVSTSEYDFKGNATSSTRRLAKNYKTAVDLSALAPFVDIAPDAAFDSAGFNAAVDVLLEAERFTTSTAVDALNRPTAVTTPDNSTLRPEYNEANFLNALRGNLRGAVAQTVFVRNIDYDAKGQRTAIVYGNGVRTSYAYDALTFRLRTLTSTRNPQPPEEQASSGWPGNGLQGLRYTYDAAGNITHIRDTAQQTIFFRNKRVEPSNEYTYDALSRLVQAEGREHLGQLGTPIPLTHDDSGRSTNLSPGDGNAMGRYLQRYAYDAVGNILQLAHASLDAPANGWHRDFNYNATSLLEPGLASNRLSRTVLNGVNEPYAHDAHGSMTRMPHLPLMAWDYRDQLARTARQVRENGTPEITYYVYDSGGQRVRKVTEREAAAGATPTRARERIYLGGIELYRDYANNGTGVELERETLHITDGAQRICLMETKTVEEGVGVPTPLPLVRYQLANHLGSCTVEVDEAARVISYEEFYPYGSASYHMANGAAEASVKRYRYTGMERDDESGLGYHGLRYFITGLFVWISTDPIDIEGGINLYCYVTNNPVLYSDVFGMNKECVSVGRCASSTISADGTETIEITDRSDRVVLDEANEQIDRGRVVDGEYVFGFGDGIISINELAKQCTTLSTQQWLELSTNVVGAKRYEYDEAVGSLVDAQVARNFEWALYKQERQAEMDLDQQNYGADGSISTRRERLAAAEYHFSTARYMNNARTMVTVFGPMAFPVAYPLALGAYHAASGNGGEALVALFSAAIGRVGSGKGRTRLGVRRTNRTDWRQFRDQLDQTGWGAALSTENRKRIARGLTPTVDRAWVSLFPEDRLLMGEQLRMHHINGSKLTVPLAESAHYGAHGGGNFRGNAGGTGGPMPGGFTQPRPRKP